MDKLIKSGSGNIESEQWADELISESTKKLIEKGQREPISKDESWQVYEDIISITDKKFSPSIQIKILKLDEWLDDKSLTYFIIERAKSLTKEVCLYIANNSSPESKIKLIGVCSEGQYDDDLRYILKDKEIQKALFNSSSLEVKDYLIYHLFGGNKIREQLSLPLTTNSPVLQDDEFGVPDNMEERVQGYLLFLKQMEEARNHYMEEISKTLKPSMIGSDLTDSEFRNIQLEGLFNKLLIYIVNNGDSFEPIDKNSEFGSNFLEKYMNVCRNEAKRPELFIKENDTTFELTTGAKIAFVKHMKVKSVNLVDLARELDELVGTDGHGLDTRFDKVIELAQKHNSVVYFQRNGKNPWGLSYYETYIVAGDGEKSEKFCVGESSGNYALYMQSFVEKFKKKGLITDGICQRNRIGEAKPYAMYDDAAAKGENGEDEKDIVL